MRHSLIRAKARLVLLSIVWICLSWLGALISFAQAEQPGLSKPVTVDTAPQKLSPALIEFSQQTNVQILTPALAVDDLNTQGVRGRMSLNEAMTRLLQGTSLGVRI